MKNLHKKIWRFAIIVLALSTTCFLNFSQTDTVNASIRNPESETAKRWVISEIYLGTDETSYIEFYNNSDNNALSWRDFLINLPFNVDIPPVFGFQTIKPHAYNSVSLKQGWMRWLALKYITFAYGDDTLHEITDALDEKPNYSYQRCQYYDNDNPLISKQFYYGQKTRNKGIDCADHTLSSTRPQDQAEPNQCIKININEIYTNTEPEKQFVEFINNGDQPVNLNNCFIAASREKAAPMAALDNVTLEPGAIYAQNIANLDDLPTLKKTSGLVVLVDSDQKTVVDYKRYNNAKANTSLSLDQNGEWYQTTTVTPDEANIITTIKKCANNEYLDEEQNECVKKANPPGKDQPTPNSPERTLVLCKDGYERNPETNRCVKKKLDQEKATDHTDIKNLPSQNNTLSPCPNGQYRDPITNRCRKFISQPSASRPTISSRSNRVKKLAPCKEGYERNPETNRCVKKAAKLAEDKKLKPCKEGYERNPETNRCVKKKSTDTPAKYPVKTEKTKTKNSFYLIAILGSVAALCLIIIIYQYRQEIARFFKALFSNPSKQAAAVDDKALEWLNDDKPKDGKN